MKNEKLKKTEEEWKAQLSEDEYRVTREAGTEPAFSGKYYNNKEAGVYSCICCGEALFVSGENMTQVRGGQVFIKQKMMWL